MPVRTYQSRPPGFHQTISANGYNLESDGDIEKLNKSLVFLDLNTGLSNRGITRDPICGLGDLPPEVDPLQGCALRHHIKHEQSNETTPHRDPIRLIGDLGEEYNCLYTKKSLTCNQRDDRNVITLEGDLGGELDNTRPHSGRPRNCIKNEPIRNPITGSGDFGLKEWDPIYKYDGKHNINRPEQVKRDPLTHSVPMANMGETEPKCLVKHFDLTRDTDVIRHDESIKKNGSTNSGIRHFLDQEHRNPITPNERRGSNEDRSSRSGTRHFYDKIKSEDPIRHHGLTDDIKEITSKQNEARMQAQNRVLRDPIRHCGFDDGTKEVGAPQHRGHSNKTHKDEQGEHIFGKQ